MASFRSTVVTNNGISLITSAMSGSETILFTNVKTGNGTYTGIEELKTATELKTEKQMFSVSGVTKVDSNNIKVRCEMSNSALLVGYYMNEIGIYAKIEGGTEVLLGITTAINADFFPDKDTAPTTIIFEMYIQISDTSQISFSFEFPEGVYATIEDLETKADIKKHNLKTYTTWSQLGTTINDFVTTMVPGSSKLTIMVYDADATILRDNGIIPINKSGILEITNLIRGTCVYTTELGIVYTRSTRTFATSIWSPWVSSLTCFSSMAQFGVSVYDIPTIFLAMPLNSEYRIESHNSTTSFYLANPGLPSGSFECIIHKSIYGGRSYAEITEALTSGLTFNKYYAPINSTTGVVGTWQKIFSANNLLTTIEEVSAVTAAGKGIDALVAKGLIESLTGTVVTILSTGWVKSTEYSGYKEYRITISSITTVSPDWGIFPVSTVPTTAEQTAYNLIQYLVGDTDKLEIVFLATTAPTTNISIVVKGVIV